MKLKFVSKDYKIHSHSIYYGITLFLSIALLVLLVCEWIFDLYSTNIGLISWCTASAFLFTYFAFRFPDSVVLRSSFILFTFLVCELHFLNNPAIFHVILYWLPFIPVAGLIIAGLRTALFSLIVILLAHSFNSWWVANTFGPTYTITINQVPFLITGLIFMIAALVITLLLYNLLGKAYEQMKLKNEELLTLQNNIKEKKQLLEKYHKSLIHIARNELTISISQQNLFEIVCHTAAQVLKTNRVSIWLLENNNQQMVRVQLFEGLNRTNDQVLLQRENYPTYFHALETESYIMATDAQTHVHTREFATSYLLPQHIHSMLDCPIRTERKTIGVICCEHMHEQKVWNAEDALYVQSLADLISMHITNDRIKQLLTDVRNQNHELIEKNNEIAAMNEELNALNEELTTLNESLELTVQNRTLALETKNRQLTEYAFINSHLLRAPLARILGLSRLLEDENISPAPELMRALITSSEELDQIIRRISDILYDGNNLTREDIKEMVDRRLNP